MRSLSVNPWLAACQLWHWLLFCPSAWQQLVAGVDGTLSPAFALAELDWRQWRHPAIRRLFLAGYLVAPVTLLGLTLFWLTAFGQIHPRALLFASCGLALGLLFGFVICAGCGLMLTALLGPAFAVVWGREQFLLVDLLWGNDIGLLLGLTSALTTHIIGNLTSHARLRSVRRQTGSALITLLVSGGVTAFITALAVILFQFRSVGGLPNSGIGLVMAAVPALVVGWSITWRSRYRASGLATAIFTFFWLWFTFRNPGSVYGDSIGGDLLLWLNAWSLITVYFGFFALAYIPITRLTTPWLATLAGSLSGLAIFGAMKLSATYFSLWSNVTLAAVLVFLGMTMHRWRPLLCYPLQLAWDTLLLRLDEERTLAQPTLLAWHTVFWDELQFLPLSLLDQHLLLLHERSHEQAQAMLTAVSRSRQRWAAIAAQIELDVRQLERCAAVEEIAHAHQRLTVSETNSPASTYLRLFAIHSRDVAAALAQLSLYNQRLALSAIEREINNLARELLRADTPYATRFQPVTAHWQQILSAQIQQLVAHAELRQEIPNPYVVGVPLTKQQEIFVGRSDISRRIEELLRHDHHPPLLLYGQRRMGKTSLLYNLRWMLPHRILPLIVDLQGPVAQASSHASFLYNLAKGMSRSANGAGISMAELQRATFQDDPFTVFDDWLDSLERTVVAHNHSIILLALDEFEALDVAFARQQLNPDAVLGTLRHLIQHRARFKLLLAGSHTLDEFQRWSSYLINAQTIYLGYLQESEARQLIEQPMQDFPLLYESQAVQYILTLTRRHPFLVQLLCSELVNAKNEQAPDLRRRVTLADVESVTQQVLMLGSQFFADIELNQVDADGQRFLRLLASHPSPTGCAAAELMQHFGDEAHFHAMLAALQHREVIEEVNGCICFQVELIRRWFAQ